MDEVKSSPLIHVAKIATPSKGSLYLFLRKIGPHQYQWFEETEQGEQETAIQSQRLEEALLRAQRHWKMQSFQLLNCGFRYNLPERDEHGVNALFYQMAASYTQPLGIYYDEEVGHNCVVNFASEEARKLFKQLKAEKRL